MLLHAFHDGLHCDLVCFDVDGLKSLSRVIIRLDVGENQVVYHAHGNISYKHFRCLVHPTNVASANVGAVGAGRVTEGSNHVVFEMPISTL